MGIGFLKDFSDVTCWKALRTQECLERPWARGGHKPRSGMSRKERCTHLLFQVTGFWSQIYDPRFFHRCRQYVPLPPRHIR